ncbi:hypothetical protein ACP4OV_022773 [Aristida adscensionis]
MEQPPDIHISPRQPILVSDQQKMEEFWRKRQEEIEAIEDFGERAIPMTRLKRVICAEKGNMMMTFDTPSFLTKACEIFVQELAFRAWICADSHHRCIILDSDIAEAIATTESYDFLKDVVHAYWEKCKSIPHAKPSKKHHRSNDQQPTSRHRFSLQYQVPQFGPQFVRYVPHVPTPLPPTNPNLHSMPLPFPFLQQQAPLMMASTITPTPFPNGAMPSINYMARGLGFFKNNINTRINNVNNVVVSSVMIPLQGALPNIPNTPLNMTSVVAATDDGHSVSTSIIATHDEGLAFHLPSQTNSNGTWTATSINEWNNIASENTNCNIIYAAGCSIDDGNIDLIGTISVDDDEQHLEQEAVTDHHLNAGQESLDVEAEIIYATTGACGTNYSINQDEVEITNGPLMDKFWDDLLVKEDVPLPHAASTDDIPQLCSSNMEDLEGFNNHETYLLEETLLSSSIYTGGQDTIE